MIVRLGEVVQYRQALDNRGKSEYHDWPGIVYKGWPGEEGDFLGIFVIMEGVAHRFSKVKYSAEPMEGCWSLVDYESNVLRKEIK